MQDGRGQKTPIRSDDGHQIHLQNLIQGSQEKSLEEVCVKLSRQRFVGKSFRDETGNEIPTPKKILDYLLHKLLPDEDQVTDLCADHFKKKKFSGKTSKFNVIKLANVGRIISKS